MNKNICALAFCALLNVAPAHALLVDDVVVESVTGSGANRAYLVIDFDETSANHSFTFEYRWDPGTSNPSGWDMLSAIDIASAELTIDSGGAPGQGFGVFINDISYGGLSRGVTSSGEFWAYWRAEGSDPQLPDDWDLSAESISARMLSNNSWDGFSIPFGSVDPYPAPPAPDVSAVPLPAPILLLFSGLFAIRLISRSSPL